MICPSLPRMVASDEDLPVISTALDGAQAGLPA